MKGRIQDRVLSVNRGGIGWQRSSHVNKLTKRFQNVN